MKTNLADFASYKKKFDAAVVYVGDMVEWEDYDGQHYNAVIARIVHKDVDGVPFVGVVDSLPIWEKDDYIVHFEGGMEVIADAIVRKLVKKAQKTVTGATRYRQVQ